MAVKMNEFYYSISFLMKIKPFVKNSDSFVFQTMKSTHDINNLVHFKYLLYSVEYFFFFFFAFLLLGFTIKSGSNEFLIQSKNVKSG